MASSLGFTAVTVSRDCAVRFFPCSHPSRDFHSDLPRPWVEEALDVSRSYPKTESRRWYLHTLTHKSSSGVILTYLCCCFSSLHLRLLLFASVHHISASFLLQSVSTACFSPEFITSPSPLYSRLSTSPPSFLYSTSSHLKHLTRVLKIVTSLPV